MAITSICQKPATCAVCGRALKKHARMDDGRTLGLDCAATELYGAPKLPPLIEKLIGYLEERSGNRNGLSLVNIAKKAQKLAPYIPLGIGKNCITINRDMGVGQKPIEVARIAFI